MRKLKGLSPLPRCYLCGESSLRPVFTPMRVIMSCPYCRLAWAWPLPGRGRLERRYRRIHEGDYERAQAARWEEWKRFKWETYDALGLREMEERLGGGVALEVGCGDGHGLEVLRARGWQAAGVEINPSLADRARGRGFMVRQGPIESQALPPRSHDLAVLFHVIEHLTDPGAVLGQIHGALRPGGRIVVETPLSWDLDNRDHLFFFSGTGLGRLLSWTGFHPLGQFFYVDEVNGHDNLAMVAERLAGPGD